MVFARTISDVRCWRSVGQVAVGEVVAGSTLVAGDPSAFENRNGEARQPAYVDLVDF